MTDLATFAARFSLTPDQAVTLPAIFDKAAQSVGMPVRALVSQATFTNHALGEYIAEVARKVQQETGVTLPH